MRAARLPHTQRQSLEAGLGFVSRLSIDGVITAESQLLDGRDYEIESDIQFL
jgi:hypothetical protein